MAATQRDISVSEFFAKNRHLLGFDNPRKALLTTVKEAVDNSLDACEEAGILPEIWVHIEPTGSDRFKVGVQDNGPGILKKQIPLIFGKLLYGSKFHRLRQSRGQQGIGISAAGMYGVQTTGKPVKIISKVGQKKPAHYYEIQIDTKKNEPKILNGGGDGVDMPPGAKGAAAIDKHGIEWVEQPHGTRVTIELEAKYVRGRGSVDEYLQQTAIANPHVSLHYHDPDGDKRDYARSANELAAGAEGDQAASVRRRAGPAGGDAAGRSGETMSQFLTTKFSRVSPGVARKICGAAKVSPRANTGRLGRKEADAIYQAIQTTKIAPPVTDCISPIGEELILKGLHQVVPGEFYAAATRPPAVYRGNPFQIEVGIAFGGQAATQNVTKDLLRDLIEETDARTIRQFLIHTFNGLGSRRGRPDSQRPPASARGNRRPVEAEGSRRAARGDEGRERFRRADDGSVAVCQSRAAAVFAGQLRDHANDPRHQLAELRPVAVARRAAEGAGHGDGSRGERVGAVHERIEGSDRQLSGDSKGVAAWAASGRPQAGHVRPPADAGEAARRSAADFPALPGRSGVGGERNQRRRSGRTLRPAA